MQIYFINRNRFTVYAVYQDHTYINDQDNKRVDTKSVHYTHTYGEANASNGR